MITDIHRHFVPVDFFDFVKARPEFSVKVKREEGDDIDVDIRGMHFGLNKTFFDLPRQIARMKRKTLIAQFCLWPRPSSITISMPGLR